MFTGDDITTYIRLLKKGRAVGDESIYRRLYKDLNEVATELAAGYTCEQGRRRFIWWHELERFFFAEH